MGRKSVRIRFDILLDMFKPSIQWFRGHGLPSDTKVVSSEFATINDEPGIKLILESAEWPEVVDSILEEAHLEVQVRTEEMKRKVRSLSEEDDWVGQKLMEGI